MADGKSNAEIGRELFVSEDTVKTHARRLFRKLGARDRAHAVAAGFRAGLVTLDRIASGRLAPEPRRSTGAFGPSRRSRLDRDRRARVSRLVVVGAVGERVVDAVGVAAGVLPGHVVVRVGS